MGIDAQMFVRVPRAVSDEELRRWSYLLGSMANHRLFLGYDDTICHKPLESIDVYEQDGPDILPSQGETFLTVPLSSRYYGEGYERGDLLAFVGIAEFLETLIADCQIWYGGDSSGVHAEPFHRARRAELLRHAAEHAHDPYEAAFASIRKHDDPPQPECPVCAVMMPQCGFGPAYALFRCSGCGWEIQYRNAERKQGFNLAERIRLEEQKERVGK